MTTAAGKAQQMNGRRLRIIVANVGDNPHTRPNITAPNARAMLRATESKKKEPHKAAKDNMSIVIITR